MTTELALTPTASAAAAVVAVKAEVRNLVVTGPDIQGLLNAVSVDLAVLPEMEVDSPDMAAELRVSLGRLATVSAAIEAERLERGKPLRETLQWLQDGYGPAKLKVDNIIAAGKGKLNTWEHSERERVRLEREAAEEAARLQAAEAARLEAEALAAAAKLTQDAQVAAAAGSEQVAQAMETQAMVAVDTARQNAAQAAAAIYARPAASGPAPKAAGVVWKAECTDKAALITHIAQMILKGDKSLMRLVELDPKAINDLAKLQQQHLNVPGLRPYTEARATRITKVAVSA